MSVPLERFLDDLLPALPGCPVALAQEMALRACQAIARESKAWVQELPPMDGVAGQARYPLVPPEASQVVQVLRVWYANQWLTPALEGALDIGMPGWRTQTARSVTFYLLEAPDVLRLAYLPDTALPGGLVVHVALAPADGASAVDDRFYTRCRSMVADWAKWQLMLIPKKPYSDPNTALFHRAQYEDALGSLKLEAARHYTMAPFEIVERAWL